MAESNELKKFITLKLRQLLRFVFVGALLSPKVLKRDQNENDTG